MKVELKDIACSLQWAKRLKEENIKQDSLFWWKEHESRWSLSLSERPLQQFIDCGRAIAAFTVQEFNNVFPKIYRLAHDHNEWKLGFEDQNDCLVSIHLPNETNMANVYAKMLLSIIKNKQKMIDQRLKELK